MPTPVACHDDNFRALTAFDAVFVVVDDAGGHVARVHRDFAHPAVCRQLDAGALRHGPIGHVGAAFRARGAAGVAWAQVGALFATLVLSGRDGAIGWPPVPTEFVETAGDLFAHATHRHMGKRRVVRRIGRIAGQAGDADVAVVFGEKGVEQGVVDWPVVGDAVEGLDAEVGGVETGKMRGVENRAAADGVEVGDRDGRVVVVDRIVRRAVAEVGTDRVIPSLQHFPVAPVARVFGGIHPVALFHAHDAHPGFGEAPRDGGAGRTRAYNQDINDIVGQGQFSGCTRLPQTAQFGFFGSVNLRHSMRLASR